MNYKAALFDLDGTLLDTGEGVLSAAQTVIESEGAAPLGESELRSFVGPPIQKSFAQSFGLDKREADRWAARFRELYSSRYLFEAKIYDGVLETLASLKEHGIALAVATYKRQDYAIRLLKHFGLDKYMSCMFGSDDAGVLTKADIIAKAASSLRVPRDETLMVGDTEHDAQGACQAGISFLGVTYGYGFTGYSKEIGFPCVGMVSRPKDIFGYFA